MMADVKTPEILVKGTYCPLGRGGTTIFREKTKQSAGSESGCKKEKLEKLTDEQ